MGVKLDWGGSLPCLGDEETSSEVFFLVFGAVAGESGDFFFFEKEPRPDELRLRMLPRAAKGLLDCWTPSLARF